MIPFTGIPRPLLAVWSRRIFATGAAALVLTLSVLSASPQLHRWLHPDAGQPDHECAVTLFHHGVTGAAVEVAVAVVSLLLVLRRRTAPAGPDLIAPRFRWFPGRAPPAR